MNPGRMLDRALRTAADWRVLLACLVAALLATAGYALVRVAFSAAGVLPRGVAPWESPPSGTAPSVAVVYALAAVVSAGLVGSFTSGLSIHAAALSLADEDAGFGAVWRRAARTWTVFMVPLGAATLVSQLAFVMHAGRNEVAAVASVAVQVLAALVGLWSTLVLVSAALTGARLGPASLAAIGLLGRRGLAVIGGSLLLAIPAAMFALALIVAVSLPGLGDVLKSKTGLAQTLVTLAVMPVITAFTFGGWIELYVQLAAPKGSHTGAAPLSSDRA